MEYLENEYNGNNIQWLEQIFCNILTNSTNDIA